MISCQDTLVYLVRNCLGFRRWGSRDVCGSVTGGRTLPSGINVWAPIRQFFPIFTPFLHKFRYGVHTWFRMRARACVRAREQPNVEKPIASAVMPVSAVACETYMIVLPMPIKDPSPMSHPCSITWRDNKPGRASASARKCAGEKKSRLMSTWQPPITGDCTRARARGRTEDECQKLRHAVPRVPCGRLYNFCRLSRETPCPCAAHSRLARCYSHPPGSAHCPRAALRQTIHSRPG
jgi:hypothetical protein